MKIRRFFTRLCVVFGMGGVSLTQAGTPWPESVCADGQSWLGFAEVAFCFNRDDIRYLNYRNLNSPSMHIHFNRTANPIAEVRVGRLDDLKTTGGLHDRLGLTVRDLFVDLTAGALSEGPDKEIVQMMLSIDAATDFRHYQKAGLDAFVILRKSSQWDAVIILDDNRDGSLHLTGQFQPKDVEWLLARLQY